jgi:site-specific DNA-adenine methylase
VTLKAPFPYFGGKHRAAPTIWQALGDPGGYVEPFAGSAAVLLARPSVTGGRVETLNDADGWLVNTWRSIQLSPDAVADAASGPVTEIDYHARLAWLQARRDADLVAWLEGDPEHHDARAAGWWLYVCACGIGDPWERGPWSVVDGHLRKVGDAGKGVNRELPHLGDAGQGVKRKLPNLCPPQGTMRANGGTPLQAYMQALSARLASARITCGDWKRVVTPSAIRATRGGDGSIAILLDPPYATSGDLYAHVDADVSHAVREWCMTADATLRIALCGFEEDHDALLTHGWRKVQGKAGSGSGYSSDVKAHKRERLWLSPACLGAQMELGL